MIRPLRTVHRWTFFVLAVGLPAVLMAAVLYKNPLQTVASLPLSQQLGSRPEPLHRQFLDRGVGFAVTAEFIRVVLDPSRAAVTVELLRASDAPDLILYWAPGAGQAQALPDGAVLLGALKPSVRQTFVLPEEVRQSTGRLIFYSLGHRSITDTMEIAFDYAAHLEPPKESP